MKMTIGHFQSTLCLYICIARVIDYKGVGSIIYDLKICTEINLFGRSIKEVASPCKKEKTQA